MEENLDGKFFLNVVKILKEVFRVLRLGGVLIIIIEILENLEGNWFVYFVLEVIKRWYKRLLMYVYIKNMFEDVGFLMKLLYKILMVLYFLE